MNEPQWIARQKWGEVFRLLRDARECSNTAWYFVEDKRAWKEEDIHRIEGLERELRSYLNSWNTINKP